MRRGHADAETELYTPAQAATLTSLAVKTVNNAIDKRTIARCSNRKHGAKSTRLVGAPALVYLFLERELMDDTTPAFRRKLFKAIETALAKGNNRVAVGPFLTLDFKLSWQKLAQRIKDLRRAERLAAIDAEILGGVPAFRGTRVPIHLIAELLAKGESPERLREGYPRLTDEMIRLAPIYAGAHPLRGRPRKRAWRGGRANARVIRVPLGDAPRREISDRRMPYG
jgi:uncharacterized protein (DUF433 family)